MAVSRRSSQQQQTTLQSPPRNAVISTPPDSPLTVVGSSSLVSTDGSQECSGSMEPTPASPEMPTTTTTALASPLCSSSSSHTNIGGTSSCSTSPGSGATSPGEGVCATGGAFRELFEACRNGDVSRVKRLVDSVNVNAKDMAGRKSTPLHFAAGLAWTRPFMFVNICGSSWPANC